MIRVCRYGRMTRVFAVSGAAKEYWFRIRIGRFEVRVEALHWLRASLR